MKIVDLQPTAENVLDTYSDDAIGRNEDVFRFVLDSGDFDTTVLEINYANDLCATTRPVRPLPEGGGFFENVWREYRENKNIY